MTDGDSMTINNLRDFANGTFVTLDDYLPLTVSKPRKQGKNTQIFFDKHNKLKQKSQKTRMVLEERSTIN